MLDESNADIEADRKNANHYSMVAILKNKSLDGIMAMRMKLRDQILNGQ